MLARALWHVSNATDGSSAQKLVTELMHQSHPRVGGKKSYSLPSTSLEKAMDPG